MYAYARPGLLAQATTSPLAQKPPQVELRLGRFVKDLPLQGGNQAINASS